MSDWQGKALPAPGARGRAAPPPATPSAFTRSGRSPKATRELIAYLFAGGLLASIIGAIVAVTQNPGVKVDAYGVRVNSGNEAVYAFGLILGGLGYTLTLIALIAWGVMLGVRAGRD